MLRLFSNGKDDILSWYRIWESVEAVFAVCARQHLEGTYTKIGEFSFFANSTLLVMSS